MTPIGISMTLQGADAVQAGVTAVSRSFDRVGPSAQRAEQAATRSLSTVGVSSAQTAAAMRMVPAQFTDIVVSLQSGQQPLTVLLQQGGQLKDMFGGIVPAARALSGYIVGLINPVTLLAAGVIALGAAYYQGTREIDAYRVALIMSGNAAGTTAAELASMASALNKRGFSEGGAAAALAEMAASGHVAAKNLEDYTAVAMSLESRVGIPVKNTVKDLEELGKAPLEASIKLNAQYRYLTASTLAQIKAYQDEGREADASALAQQSYVSAMGSRASEMEQHLGRIERAWKAVKGVAIETWNAMVKFADGRQVDPRVEQLEKLQAQLAARQQQGGTVGSDAKWEAGNTKLQQQISALKEALQIDKDAAEQQAKNNAIQQAGISAFQAVDKANQAARTNQEKLNDALKEYRDNLEKVRAASATESDPAKRAALDAQLNPAQIAKTEAALRKQYADKQGPSTQSAERRADLSEIQNQQREEQALLRQRQQMLETSRATGLVSLEDYYQQRRALIQESAAQDAKSLQAQLARLEEEKTSGRDAITVQRQIADVRSRLMVRQTQEETELAALDQQAAQAMRQNAAALSQLTRNHQDYIDQLERRSALEVQAVAMGDRQASILQGLASISEKYLQQRRQLEDQKLFAANWTAEDEQLFQRRLALLQQQQDAEVRIYQSTADKVLAAQASWTNGASKALQNYVDYSANVAAQTANAVTNAFQGMEDALVTFVTTGKLSFSSLANSIVADITRIIIKQQISNAIGVAGGSGGGLASLVGAGLSMFGGTSAVASTASALPGDSLDNFIALSGFDGGGYTGAGGRLEPAGIVHRGEYVINAASTRALGLDFLGRLNGYAGGGYVGGGSAASTSVGGGAPQVIQISVAMPQGARRETAVQFGRDVARQISVAQSRNG